MSSNSSLLVQEHNGSLAHPKYRADIDGLRAIAVMAVVAFHAFPSLFKGGFIGVDMFFVISGYLISLIIINGLDNGNFSFAEFYNRRIKRIFPALFLVLVSCYVYGWFLLFPEEYEQLGKHIAGGAGFISNLIFWSESGYFDVSADEKPLLHLWSLGVEEQFYLLWPLLLWLAYKIKLDLLIVTFVILCISFFFNILYIGSGDTVAAFYAPHARFWELLAGSILACLTLRGKETFSRFPSIICKVKESDRMRLCNSLSIIGVLLISSGFLLVDKESLFPGGWAIFPVLGTFLIILAGKDAWINRAILSNRLLVWIGLISFPLYLWHWPLLSFAYIVHGTAIPDEHRVFIVIISIILAWVTYQLVEKPIRLGGFGRIKVSALIFLIFCTGCAGYGSFENKGFASRHSAEREGNIGDSAFFDHLKSKYADLDAIDLREQAFDGAGFYQTRQSKVDSHKSLAIIGDSHAEHLFPGFADMNEDINVFYWTANFIPLLSSKEFDPVYQYIVNDENITTVVISAAWYRRMGMQISEKELDEIYSDRDNVMAGLKEAITDLVRFFTKANKKVYLVDDVPHFVGINAKPCKYLTTRTYTGKPPCTEHSNIFHKQYRIYYPTLLDAVEGNPNAEVLHVAKYFCSEDFQCTMDREGVVLFRDRHHLNLDGSRFLAQQLVDNHELIIKEP